MLLNTPLFHLKAIGHLYMLAAKLGIMFWAVQTCGLELKRVDVVASEDGKVLNCLQDHRSELVVRCVTCTAPYPACAAISDWHHHPLLAVWPATQLTTAIKCLR